MNSVDVEQLSSHVIAQCMNKCMRRCFQAVRCDSDTSQLKKKRNERLKTFDNKVNINNQENI